MSGLLVFAEFVVSEAACWSGEGMLLEFWVLSGRMLERIMGNITSLLVKFEKCTIERGVKVTKLLVTFGKRGSDQGMNFTNLKVTLRKAQESEMLKVTEMRNIGK